MILQPVPMKEQDLLLLERRKVVEALAKFRQEWQALAEGQNLLDVQTSVGLILVDIAEMLELNEQEKVIVLGRKMVSQASAFAEQRVRKKAS